MQGRARTKARATCTTWSQSCCGRSSMMPNESAREKTARREATVDRQKGFWMVGRVDFFGADQHLSDYQLAEKRIVHFIVCQHLQICRQGAEALGHDCGRFRGACTGCTRGKDTRRHTVVRIYRVGGGSSSPDGRPCSAELPLSCSFDAAPHDRGKEREGESWELR